MKKNTWKLKLPSHPAPLSSVGFCPQRLSEHLERSHQNRNNSIDSIVVVNTDIRALTEKAWVMCTQNSTAMPTDMIRFTTDSAFSWIWKTAITPWHVSNQAFIEWPLVTWVYEYNYLFFFMRRVNYQEINNDHCNHQQNKCWAPKAELERRQ